MVFEGIAGEGKMKCIALVAALCFVSVGCCTKKPVPVPCPQPPTIQEPDYRTDKMDPSKVSLEELVVALTLDLMETKATLKRTIVVIEGYRTPSSSQEKK